MDGIAQAPSVRFAELAEDACAYILDDPIEAWRPRWCCGARRRPGSPYCARHHAVCHIPGGSTGETERLREAEALAAAVGGRRGRATSRPSDRFLRRLENAVRVSSRLKCSRIVL